MPAIHFTYSLGAGGGFSLGRANQQTPENRKSVVKCHKMFGRGAAIIHIQPFQIYIGQDVVKKDNKK